jgi:hypothetical protein
VSFPDTPPPSPPPVVWSFEDHPIKPGWPRVCNCDDDGEGFEGEDLALDGREDPEDGWWHVDAPDGGHFHYVPDDLVPANWWPDTRDVVMLARLEASILDGLPDGLYMF